MIKFQGLSIRTVNHNVQFVYPERQQGGLYRYPGVRIIQMPGKGLGVEVIETRRGNLYFYAHYTLPQKEISRMRADLDAGRINPEWEYVVEINSPSKKKAIAYDGSPDLFTHLKGLNIGAYFNEATSGTPELFGFHFSLVRFKDIPSDYLMRLPREAVLSLCDVVVFVESMIDVIPPTEDADVWHPRGDHNKFAPIRGPVEGFLPYHRDLLGGQCYLPKPWFPRTCARGWNSHLPHGGWVDDNDDRWREQEEKELEHGHLVLTAYGVDLPPASEPLAALSTVCSSELHVVDPIPVVGKPVELRYGDHVIVARSLPWTVYNQHTQRAFRNFAARGRPTCSLDTDVTMSLLKPVDVDEEGEASSSTGSLEAATKECGDSVPVVPCASEVVAFDQTSHLTRISRQRAQVLNRVDLSREELNHRRKNRRQGKIRWKQI